MGAHNIEFDMKNGPFSEVKKRFDKQQEYDRQENGDRSYSGDFQTVDEVVDHLGKTFSSYTDAHDYCMDKAVKWDNVIAVRYKDVGKETKKIANMRKNISKQKEELYALKNKLEKAVSERKSTFIGCSSCSGKFKKEYIQTGASCPICRQSLISKTGKTRIANKENKIKLLMKKLKTEVLANNKKKGETRILVAGWGAC